MTLTAQEGFRSVVVAGNLPPRRKKLTQKPLTSRKTGLILTYRKFCRRYRRTKPLCSGCSEDGKQPVDRLIIDETQRCDFILSALTLLEVKKGYVKRLPARYYELAKK